MRNKKVSYKNYNFSEHTRLSVKRMKKIDKWIDTLTEEQREFLNDLLDDKIDETRREEAEYYIAKRRSEY